MIAIPRRFDAFLSESNHFLALKVCMNDINDFPIKFKTQLSQLIKWQHGKKYLRKKVKTPPDFGTFVLVELEYVDV